MGLAPYGQPTLPRRRCARSCGCKADGGFELDLRYFRHHREKIAYQWEGRRPAGRPTCSRRRSRSCSARARDPTSRSRAPPRHRPLGAGDVRGGLLPPARPRCTQRYRPDRPRARRRLRDELGRQRQGPSRARRSSSVYVQSAAGDAGGAIGAAFAVWHKLGRQARRFVMDHAYWGPAFDDDEIAALLAERARRLRGSRLQRRRASPTRRRSAARPPRRSPTGKVVGWFQGRMEWGPRALGNRSILGDPRRADMKDILNAKIKRRESFRPFAPSVLREAVGGLVRGGRRRALHDAGVPDPRRRSARRSRPSPTSTARAACRPCTAPTNPRYYAADRGVPRAHRRADGAQHSFNENEPVVCRPEEALDCFLRTKMDVLVLGDTFIER